MQSYFGVIEIFNIRFYLEPFCQGAAGRLKMSKYLAGTRVLRIFMHWFAEWKKVIIKIGERVAVGKSTLARTHFF